MLKEENKNLFVAVIKLWSSAMCVSILTIEPSRQVH